MLHPSFFRIWTGWLVSVPDKSISGSTRIGLLVVMGTSAFWTILLDSALHRKSTLAFSFFRSSSAHFSFCAPASVLTQSWRMCFHPFCIVSTFPVLFMFLSSATVPRAYRTGIIHNRWLSSRHIFFFLSQHSSSSFSNNIVVLQHPQCLLAVTVSYNIKKNKTFLHREKHYQPLARFSRQFPYSWASFQNVKLDFRFHNRATLVYFFILTNIWNLNHGVFKFIYVWQDTWLLDQRG